jgi:RNA polymerase sigma factor (sigma-70 family)
LPSGESRIDAISSRWSLLERAHHGSTISGGQARQALTMRYMPAVQRYVRAMVADKQDAEDLAQDVAVRLLAGDFAGATPERGRFRSLLKIAVRNMVRNYWSKQKRRRPADFDPALLDDAGSPDNHDDSWDSACRAALLDAVWKRLEQEDRAKPGSTAFLLLKLRTQYPADSSEQLAERLGQKIGKPIRADAVRQQLRRARLRFADLLIEEIGAGIEAPTTEHIEDELTALGLLEFVRDLLPGKK